MSSKPSLVAYVVEQLGPQVRSKAMFGEYGIYRGEVLIALFCDDRLFLKQTPSGRALFGETVEEAPPYPGAKNAYVVPEERWDDADWMSSLARTTAEALPAKVKKPKVSKAKPKRETVVIPTGTNPIDGYLMLCTPPQRRVLEALRKKIHAAIPEAVELLSYRVPAFRLPEGMVAGFCVTRRGFSYLPFSGRTLTTLAPKLRGFEQSKGALHFTAEKPLSTALVRTLVKTRLAELKKPPAKAGPKSRRRRAI